MGPRCSHWAAIRVSKPSLARSRSPKESATEQCSRPATTRATRSLPTPGSSDLATECQGGAPRGPHQRPRSTRTGRPCSANTSSYHCRLASTAARSRRSMRPVCRAVSLAGMPKTPAAEVVAGDRAVRVSSPDRVIYEATDRTPEVSKLMVAEFFASVGDGLMRALRDRPTALERWTSGVRPGMKLATGPQDRNADAFYQKRVPKGAPDYLESVQITFPSGRKAEEICPTEIAVPVWCAHMGTLTFHPWPVRRDDVDRPDELRIDLDPQPGTTFTDATRVAAVARELFEELGVTAYVKTSGNRGIHVFVRIEPRWEFGDVRHAAIGFGQELSRRDEGVTYAWWKEARG